MGDSVNAACSSGATTSDCHCGDELTVADDILTVFDIYDLGKDWERLITYLRRFGLISADGSRNGNIRAGKRCPQRNCRAEMQLIHRLQRHGDAEFRCQKCDFRSAVFEGTFFENVHIPVEKQLLLAACFVYRCNYTFVKTQLKLGEHTAVDHLLFCREVCGQIVERASSNQQIGGPGKIVEIDESKFNKRKYNRDARQTNSAWVFGAMERGDSSKIVMQIAPQRDADTLLPIIVKNIAPGSQIVSDMWKAYCSLSSVGFEHKTLNHSVEFVSPNDPRVHTNSIEGSWFHAKRSMPTQGLVSQHMDLYLCEFLWRRLRGGTSDLLSAFLSDVALVYPPS